jgi:negative regulator of genetic competence, sporulation and motility
LDALRKQGQSAQLFPGDYRLVLTVCASQINNVVNQEDDNASTAVETVAGTGNETEDVSEEAPTEGTEKQEEAEEAEGEVSVDEV